ncbi:Ubiquinol cytochrome-c reductase assembly protein Cbp3 [Tieghemiomyces parasiticus]|uniref:Ubiquinol cytochrome-c reductase assembly protein Cbp3 n=1 Tax=Tieghemiomyces parasiticus TaxID=78921 RepID=A0A9W8A2P8_9FUNG|nr:Ubiquinol cytochrome-c reductase assembly protein Cbp3 [Tieghemiomyces parasiticus]
MATTLRLLRPSAVSVDSRLTTTLALRSLQPLKVLTASLSTQKGADAAQQRVRETALKRKVPQETELLATEYKVFKNKTLTRIIGKLFSSYKPRYAAVAISANIYTRCRDLDYRDFYIDTLGLPDTYQTWFSVTQLHVWMMIVRIRNEENGRNIQQELVNHFFNDAEGRMHQMGITSGRLINQSLKDLLAHYRGSLLAFDEATVRGDAAMAAALWRNVFKTRVARGQELAYLTKYVRTQLFRLDALTSYDLHRGYFKFDMPDNNLPL